MGSPLRFCGILVLLLVPLCADGEESAPPPQTPVPALAERRPPVLEELLLRALQHNPALKAQRANLAASQRRPSQARALPDPTVDLEFMNLAVDGSSGSDAFTEGVSLGLTQMLPYPGKRALAETVAGREVGVEAARLHLAEQELRSQVLAAAYRYTLAHELLALNARSAQALALISESALSRYAAGAASQSEVLSAQGAITRSAAERRDLESQRDIAKARLESLVAGAVDESSLAALALPAPAPLPPLEDLLAQAGRGAPGVALARAETATAEAMADSVRRESKPDFMVGGRYRYKDMTMGGKDYLTLMVGMTLPFFHRKDRYTPALEEALLRRQASLEGTSQAENEARYALAEAYQSAARDAALFALYDQGLLPQTRQAFEASLAAYRTGRSDFGALLMSLTNLFMVESDAVMARADYLQRVAEMEAVLGVPLEDAASRIPAAPRPTVAATPLQEAP